MREGDGERLDIRTRRSELLLRIVSEEGREALLPPAAGDGPHLAHNNTDFVAIGHRRAPNGAVPAAHERTGCAFGRRATSHRYVCSLYLFLSLSLSLSRSCLIALHAPRADPRVGPIPGYAQPAKTTALSTACALARSANVTSAGRAPTAPTR